jgi:HD-GYP domain-containing protein (c-di-GMP phosphodiesterase class II)
MPSEEKIRVLMVDDDPGVLESLRFEYGSKYDLTLADGQKAVEKLVLHDNKVFDVAVIDMWFGKDHEGGLKLIKWLKKHDPLLECIVLTGHPEIHNVVDSMKADAYNYVIKVSKGQIKTGEELNRAIKSAFKTPKNVQFQATLKLLKTQKTFFDKMVHRDPFFFGHGERVRAWSLAVADKLSFSNNEKLYLEFAALFHDMGKEKLGFSFKPGKLTREEEKRWRKYPDYGYDMLKEIFAPIGLQPKAILEAVKYHRRNWDGSGFPGLEPEREKGMVGENIPLLSRIIAVACEFDHGFTQRSQRFLRDPEQAKEHIRKLKDKRLDPELVDSFLEAYQEGKITQNFPYRWREEEFGRIREQVKNQRFEEARRAGEEWVRGIDQAPEFDCVRAAAYVGLGDLLAPIHSQREQALGYYTDAAQLHPSYAEAYYKRGLCFLKQNCWQEAERDFDVATAIIPTYLEAHLEKAAIFLKNFQYKKAQRLYDLVLALDHDPDHDEDNVQAFLGKAKIFLYQKIFSEALGCLNKAEDNINKFLEKKDITDEDRKKYESFLNEQKRLVEELKAIQNPPAGKASKGKKTGRKGIGK